MEEVRVCIHHQTSENYLLPSPALTMTDTMAPSNLPLTLIVAATSKTFGIGKNGSLPWRLKAEMKYFARVTTRVPSTAASNARNAVIMGRKTWESIPPKFRPLKDRVNVVLSKSGNIDGIPAEHQDVLVVDSLEQAISTLSTQSEGVGRAFVIGGSTVYESALKLPQTRSILMTQIDAEFDCDTFFPVMLKDVLLDKLGWERRSKAELEAFIGEEVNEKEVEGDVEYKYCLFGRK
ncbi:hypothetical protein K402DRAFT_428524 [Aulographum hederae CBS 113979]|uniref:Dihydrofolate reductase n=1 Tax=Aulographum hederae CBS 113979 TaxID=1176131 RepID=A0A6G1H4L3_9PEZI|nr:hypothetical protein K402DRAFT_428524 [Aulographum hederae CBS 113979]